MDEANPFAEHYLAAPAAAPHLGPAIVRLALVHFDVTNDMAASVHRWENIGFAQVGASAGHGHPPGAGLNACCAHAPALGAALVVFAAHPAPPAAVYLAPRLAHLREMANLPHSGAMPVEIDVTPPASAAHFGPLVYKAARIREAMSDDLPAAVAEWEQAGFTVLGTADAVTRNDRMGFSTALCQVAVAAGASLVLYQVTPAKARAIRRDGGGRIDMDAVRADPPASLSARGQSVTQAVFLAPTTEQARALADASDELGRQDIPLELEA